MDDFWSSQSTADYASMQHVSLVESLHPAMQRIVEMLCPKTVLDYGCGDGRFIARVSEGRTIHLFDKNPSMSSLAGRHLASVSPVCHESLESIPSGCFDLVVCSLVLLSVGTKVEYEQTLLRIFSFLRPGGEVLLSLTHPCYRECQFSDFKTEYTTGSVFNYLTEGQAFEVTLTDPCGQRSVSFVDFHWTLGFTISALCKAGFAIRMIVEVPDAEGYPDSNSTKPPFIIITAQK